MDLGMFMLKEGYSYNELLDILSSLAQNEPSVSAADLRQTYLAAEKKRKKLVKNVKRDPSSLNIWLEKPFFQTQSTKNSSASQDYVTSTATSSSISEHNVHFANSSASQHSSSAAGSTTLQHSAPEATTSSFHSPIGLSSPGNLVAQQPVYDFSKERNALKKSVQHFQTENAALKLKCEAVLEQYKDSEDRLISVEIQNNQLQRENKELNLKMAQVQQELVSLKGLTKSKIYKSNSRLKKTVSSLRMSNQTLSSKLNTLVAEIGSLKNNKLALQKSLSKEKKKNKHLREQKESVDSSAIKEILEGCTQEPKETRDRLCNRFSDNIRMTVIGLQEAGIAASKCSAVIDIVSRYLFKTVIEDLPSASTAVNIADEAHFLTKAQAAVQMLNSSDATLHTDGTSRQKQKYVGQQVTLNDGSLISLGFSEVATEDADTLLTTTINLLEELSDIYCLVSAEERSSVFKKILEHITSVMSNRAAVMQSFNSKFQLYKEECLDSNVHVHFLYCNAHFLLGLSSVCESGLKDVEEKVRAKDGALGRELSPQFKTWGSSEGATTRLIRTAADVLGPRGDEKSGVRADWLAFCRKEGYFSEITSYRSNRFNSLFENATAIFHHRDHIHTFLEHYTSPNRKLQSVLAYIADIRLQALLTSVALLHTYVTKPYWNLINSSIPYVGFYKYVQMMLANFEIWQKNPHHLPDTECKGAFNGEFLDEINTSLHEFAGHHQLVTTSLSFILSKFTEVTLRQLKDFLPGGVFGEGVSDDTIESTLQHCPLTNLSGEHAFGDLDYSIQTKRHTSLHHHSTTNMIRRNKTTEWLAAKSPSDLQSILKLSRNEAKSLRQKHRRQEELVKLRIQERIAANEKAKKEKEMAAAAEKQNITEAIIQFGGPVKSLKDIHAMLQTNNKGVDALKTQLKYIKVVLGVKNIKTTGSKAQLQTYLQNYLTGDTSSDSSPPAKRRSIEDSDSSDVISEDDSSDNSSADESAISQCFSFDRQGQWVAVYYDSTYYIGQVIEVQSGMSGIVKFLTATKGRKDYFKWPLVEDIASVETTYVFRWDFAVMPISSDGRIWSVPEIDSISKAYQRIRALN